MAHIPQITINTSNIYPGTLNRKGSMCNAYSPLKNLLDELTENLGDFTTNKLNFDLLHPVDIIIQDSYDGSVNMVLNDGKNLPRLIGSRFSVIEDGLFKVTDHTGFKDTNIYDEKTFDLDTSLKTIATGIPQVEFLGFTQFGGNLSCGSYTFYFKLADADGNESEVLAESGIVLLFIGDCTKINPKAVRMGLENENTSKSVTFKLTNLDLGFDYVHVLFARSSSGLDQFAGTTCHKIIFDYPIFDGKATITITGNETILGISEEELYTDYADIEAVKSQVVVNNALFFGNLKKKERDWDALRLASWKILPGWSQKANIGTLDNKYEPGGDSKTEGCYYNPYNVYYRVGYWPDEIYRFGIVYIFNDNSLSPVFNVPGVDFNLLEQNKLEVTKDILYRNIDGTLHPQESEPDDFYFNKKYRINSRGVIKFDNTSVYETKGGVLKPKPLYITFDLSILQEENFFEEQDIKGFFFVRQKRIPTILAQGLAVGLTKKDFGCIPTIKKGSFYTTQSFLSQQSLLLPTGKTIDIEDNNVSTNALLVPDAELSEATYNQIFVSNKYALSKIGTYSFLDNKKDNGAVSIYANNIFNTTSDPLKRKLTNVPEDIKILTDGEMYFSTIAGDLHEAYKTSDVKYSWNKTKPQDLTQSTSVIRGLWGPFVGVGEKELEDSELDYGGVYNIKKENYVDDFEKAVDLDFLLRFTSAEHYQAITDRLQYSLLNSTKIECYRGDCFISLFTHRILRNFIDPELPTNHKIIDPLCWAKNYAVRCTAIEEVDAKYNVQKENEGWYINDDLSSYANEIVQAFEVLEGDIPTGYSWDAVLLKWINSATHEELDYIPGSNDTVSTYITNRAKIQKVNPLQLESEGIGGIIKNIFKSSKWALRGLSAINRADVNAVALGLWITFPICSSKNLAFRDVEYQNITELSQFNEKESFYPLKEMTPESPLRDSNNINQAASISLPHKKYYGMPNVPFIKQEYFTRIISSIRDSADTATNEFKLMFEDAYRDYTKVYGPITKLMALGSKILVVFHHGIGVLAVNDTMSLAKTVFDYLPAELSAVITDTYGSMWKDSIILTLGYIYGVDTVAKVIWRIKGDGLMELLSPMKVEKFLIDSIDMSEFIQSPYIGRINVKSHYNAFKRDVMFTYYNDILYKFDSYSYNDKSLSEFGIDKDGYLLDDSGVRIKVNELEVQGLKVIAEYNEDTGHVDTYADKIAEDPTKFKWATGKSWSLCFSEPLGKFITFYDWIPLESENIDNIWFSFDRESANKLVESGLFNTHHKDIKPENSEFVDELYSKHSIDKAFNTTCTVNYIRGNVQFHISNTENKLNEFGLWLLGGSKYTLSYKIIKGIYKKTKLYKEVVTEELNLQEHSGWKFIVILVNKDNNILQDGYISILCNNGACTNIISSISDYIPKKFNVTILTDISESELDNYYHLRDLDNSLKLWKHGLAGIYDNETYIKPTYWYGKQHEFNFEFVARQDALHKIYNNLIIVSNKTAPDKFEFEVVGEVYDWHKYKPVLKWIADLVDVPTSHVDYDKKLQDVYKYVLSNNYGTLSLNRTFPKIFGMQSTDKFLKLPYMKVTDACVPSMDPQIIGNKSGEKYNPDTNLTPEQLNRGNAYIDNTSTTSIVYDKQLNEFRVHTELLGNDMWKYGRLRGNMQYLEDLWRVEIRPVAFRWAYLTPQTNPVDSQVFNRFSGMPATFSLDTSDTLPGIGDYTVVIENPRGNVADNGYTLTCITTNQSIDITEKSNKVSMPITLTSNNVSHIDFELTGPYLPFDIINVYLYGLKFEKSKLVETRLRDKYIKIKVRYSGEDLAVIQAISTLFDYSYA